MSDKRTRIKICGLKREQDILCAQALGADALGFVFHPASPRALRIEEAKPLLACVSAFVSTVAVLVNPEPALVYHILAHLEIDYLQFHGDESQDFCLQFQKPFIKAFSFSDELLRSNLLLSYPKAAALLIDSSSGGSGRSFDWNCFPTQLKQALILAGGLNPANVKQAISLCRPYAVDVSTGVEATKGVKDPQLLEQFINAVWDDS